MHTAKTKKPLHGSLTLFFSIIAVGAVMTFFGVTRHNDSNYVGAATESPFVDVSTNDTFYADILWAYEQGITAGTQNADGTRSFSPQNPTSREAFAAFLYRFSSSPSYTPPETSLFGDLAPTDAFYKEISWLYSVGITTGTQYYPKDNISRAAVAAFLYRLSGSPTYTPPTTSIFNDVPLSHAFYTEISWLAQTGITSGTKNADGSTSFKPDDPISREATAAFLHRLAGK